MRNRHTRDRLELEDSLAIAEPTFCRAQNCATASARKRSPTEPSMPIRRSYSQQPAAHDTDEQKQVRAAHTAEAGQKIRFSRPRIRGIGNRFAAVCRPRPGATLQAHAATSVSDSSVGKFIALSVPCGDERVGSPIPIGKFYRAFRSTGRRAAFSPHVHGSPEFSRPSALRPRSCAPKTSLVHANRARKSRR